MHAFTKTVTLLALGLTACPADIPATTDGSSSSGEPTGDTGDEPNPSTGTPTSTTDAPTPTTGAPVTTDSPETTDAPGTTDAPNTTRDETTTDGDATDTQPVDTTDGETTTTTTETTTTESGTTDDTGGEPPDDPDDAHELDCFWQDALPNLKLPGVTGPLLSIDLDGDAREELVVGVGQTTLFPSQSGVAVLGSLGGTTFAPPVLTPTAGMDLSPWSIASADFDGDGKPDVAVVDDVTHAVQVLRNQGDGSFAAPVAYFGIPSPTAVVTGDFDGDGKTDIVALTFLSDIVFLRNLGDGTFAAASPFSSGASSYLSRPVAVADLDGDGDLDLALPSYNHDTMVVRFGKGDGTFPTSAVIPTGDSPGSVAAVDFDSDGDIDLALGHGGEDAGVQVLWNLGGGSFDVPQTVEVDAAYDDTVLVFAADMDDDGHVDLVTSSPGAHWINVVHNSGVGDFFDAGTWRAGQEPISLVARDVDEDGRRDLVVSNLDDLSLSILRQHEDGSFGETPKLIDEGNFWGALIEDVTGDGKLDIIGATFGSVRVLVDDGNGDYLPAVQYLAPGSNGADPRAADLDTDGDTDLVVTGGTHVTVLLNQGDGAFVPTAYVGGQWVQDAQPGDFDGDGVLDLVTFDSTSVAVMRGLGDGTFGAPAVKLGATHPAVVEPVDLDADGDLDLVLADDPDGQPHRITVLLNDGAGNFVSSTVATHTFYMWVIARDLNGDGKPDLAVTKEETLHVLAGQGDGTFVELGSHAMGVLNGKYIQSADLDQDGILDLVAPDYALSVVGVLLGQGGGAFAPVVGYAMHANTNQLGEVKLVDLDGDDALDLVAAGSALATALNNGDGTFAPATAYTSDSNRAFAARDVDGDGKADLVTGTSKSLYLASSLCR